MKRYSIIIIVLYFSVLSCFAAGDLSDKTFKNPDREYGPMTWWHWVNGHNTRDGIHKDLVSMHKVGLRGVQVFNAHMYMPEGPVKFGSDKWLEMTKYAVEQCDSLGMKFTIMNSAGWSGSGGPWIDYDRAMKKLVFAETAVEGGKQVTIRLTVPKLTLGYYKEVAIIAIPAEYPAEQIENLDCKILVMNKLLKLTPEVEKSAIPLEKIINLTAFTDAEGNLNWKAPQGKWTILRFGYTLTGQKTHPAAYGGEGFEVDKLDSDAVNFQFDQGLNKLLKSTQKYLGNTFEGILFDSYEASYQNWTGKLPAAFKELNGYDIIPYLPVFTGRPVVSLRQSEQVLFDFRHLLDQMIAKEYYGTMQKRAHENKLIVYAEGQGGPLNPSVVLDYVDVPMNEFWNPDTRARLPKIRLTASCANLQGKQIVAAEAFTSTPENGKWQNTPWTMKKPGDLAFAGGINRYCFHSYVQQPYDLKPGFTMGRYGTLFGRLSTWWDMSGAWMQYITRSQYLLQLGETVADVAFLHHDDIRYNFAESSVRVPHGFNYEIIYPKDIQGATYTNGKVILRSGRSYKLLVVAEDTRFIDFNTLTTLAQLVKDGAVLSSMKPETNPSYKESIVHSQQIGDKLIEDMWSGLNGKKDYVKSYGKGKLFWGKKLEEVISLSNIAADINFGDQTGKGALYFIHRTMKSSDIYYITNQTVNEIKSNITFAVKGKVPQLWNAATGEISNNLTYKFTADGTQVAINFDSYGSWFIVFNQDSAPGITGQTAIPLTPLAKKVVVNGKWKITFDDTHQMKDGLEQTELTSWHLNPDERVKYYSGKATYSNQFQISTAVVKCTTKCILYFTDLYDIATVEINDKEVGTLWKKPYSIDVTNFVVSGNNRLVIHVANKWINRLIGDEQLPTDLDYQNKGSKFTNGRLLKFPEWISKNEQPADRKRIAFTTWQHYTAESPLVSSGLIGEVSLEIY